MGAGGARARSGARSPDPALGRLLGLSLVPRDGARVVRGRRDGPVHERALRPDQGRPRGAPRRRLDLHGGGPGDDRARRLAADRLPRHRGRPVLRRHLLPPDPAPGDAELPDGDGGRGPELGHPARADSRGGGADPHPARARRADRALGRSAHPGRGRGRGQRPAGGGRHGARRLRLGAQVPARLGARADADRRRARPGGDDPERDRRRRHQRSRRRWLRPLLRRRDLARPPFREDALRQRAARARLPARLPGARRRALARDRRADARLGAARDARPRGRVLLRPRRRLRGRGGVVLRLDPGRRSARSWPGPGSATRRRS